jgi:hypothetical protein
MPRSPAVRIAAARDMLSFLETFQSGARQAVLASIPLGSLDALEAGGRTGWLALEHDHWIVDGIVSVLGPDRAVQCWTASVADLVGTPLLRNFVSGMLRLFGKDQTRIIGVFPQAWSAVYQDFCEVELSESSPTYAVLAFNDIAPVLREYPNYFHAFRGVVQGFCALAGMSGVTFLLASDSRSARAQFRWEHADPPAPQTSRRS